MHIFCGSRFFFFFWVVVWGGMWFKIITASVIIPMYMDCAPFSLIPDVYTLPFALLW